MKSFFIIIGLGLALSLQGCFFVAGAAAGAAGVAVVYDHRKLEKIMLDESIAKKINKKIHSITDLHKDTHIEVSCFNQIVLLTGETTSADISEQAEEFAHNTPDVKRVYNQVTIKGPISTLTKTSDTWITTKIKTRMLATKGLKSGTIKVVTENGTVYLMGIVSHEQADIAADISSETAGVQRVMKIFEYTD
jgi:osmotically-inducible protein OsmY